MKRRIAILIFCLCAYLGLFGQFQLGEARVIGSDELEFWFISDYHYSRLEIADLDGDELDDLIVNGAYHGECPPYNSISNCWYNSYAIAWYQNDGSGGIQFQGILFEDTWFEDTLNLIDLIPVDIDHDDDTDLLAIYSGYYYYDNVNYTEIYWLENDGTGQFQERLVFEGSGVVRNEAALADLDGDSDLDLIMHYENQSEYNVVWFSQSPDGSFGLEGTIYPSEGSYFNNVATADMDGDSIPDVIIGYYYSGEIFWIRNESGNFGSVHPMYSQMGLIALLPGDIDLDGDVDILCRSDQDNQVFWLENDSSGLHFTRHSVGIGGGYLGSYGPGRMVLLDFDGDDDLDILASSSTYDWEPYSVGHSVTLIENIEGIFSSPVRIIDNVIEPTSLAMVNSGTGPGDLVLLTHVGSILRLPQTGPNEFGELESLRLPFRFPIQFADINGDAEIDMLGQSGAISYIRLNAGDEQFTEVEMVQANLYQVDALLADLDGDGDADVIETSEAFGTEIQLAWRENDGSGSFGSPISITNNYGYDTKPIDFNHDGHMDLLYNTGSRDGLVLMNNQGGASAFSYEPLGIDVRGEWAVVDLDADGLYDFLGHSPGQAGLFWYRGSSGAGYNSTRILESIGPIYHLEAEDINGDGHKDILIGSSGEIQWMSQYGSGNFGEPVTIGLYAGGDNVILAEDFDQDGDIDLIFDIGTYNRAVQFLENNGAGSFSEYTLLEADSNHYYKIQLAEDVNNDTIPDLVIKDDLTGKVIWFENPSPRPTSYGQCTNLFFSEYIEGSSFNKVIEIYNPTESAVDLSGYQVDLYLNGATEPDNTLNWPAGTMLGSCEVYVISNPSADPVFLAQADTTSSVTFYNGDDALELSDAVAGVSLDVIGEIGVDPGSNWPVGSGATSEFTLVRKREVNDGTTNWSAGALQWDVLDRNFADSLGFHNIDNCETMIKPIASFASTMRTGREGPDAINRDTAWVNLAAADELMVTVTGGTATLGDDFSLVMGTGLYTISNGQELLAIPFFIEDDSSEEDDETFEITISDPDEIITIGNATFSYTIVDDDGQPTPCEYPFFSEYIEGSASNKTIELYNPTYGDIDLGNYRINRFDNGNDGSEDTSGVFYWPAGTMISSGEVYVIGHPNADPEFLFEADTTDAITFYSGDDALQLEVIDARMVVDQIGRVGEDPGTSWPVGEGTTREYTLVRDPEVQGGQTNWFLGAETWLVFERDFSDSLGAHYMVPCDVVDPCDTTDIVIDAMITDESAEDEDDGAINISVTGGTPPYSFLWNTGATNEDITGLDGGTYDVTVEDANSCTGIANVLVGTGTSVNNIAALKTFQVYPKPASDRLFIELQMERSLEVQLSVVDVSGRTVYERAPESADSKIYQLSPDWPAGIYFLKIIAGDDLAVEPIIIAR